MKIVLNRFWNLKCQLFFEISDLKTCNEVCLESDRLSGKTNGEYEIINDQIIAVFSFSSKNYFILREKIIEISENIVIEYFVAQNIDEESWFKIYENSELIFEINYINPHKPFLLPDPFAYDEDFNTTNFLFHFANYIEKVKQNKNIVLFPS